MKRISERERGAILELRLNGYSIPEIVARTGSAKTTVQRYVKDVTIPAEFRKRLREKQGGSKDRAKGLRENVHEEVVNKIGVLSERDYYMLLIGLYWGEGTKKDFSLINSDPVLIKTFLHCLHKLGIPKSRVAYSLRIHSNISAENAKEYWENVVGVSKDRITRIEVIEGKKKGKLPHGMCRIRVLSGIKERLLIQEAIVQIGKDSSDEVVSL